MKLFLPTITILICALGATIATAQDRASTARSSTDKTDKSATNASQAQAAIDRAAAANKYVFLFFWKEDNPQTGKAKNIVEPAVAKMSDKADFVSMRINDPNPAEKKLVDKYGVNGAPMPLVLAIAPSGAITKAFTKIFDDKELRTAFVSPCKERCLKALQSRKLVLVCVVDQANLQDKIPVPKGVDDFKADARYGAATEIVLVNVRNAAERTFLTELDIAPRFAPITVFLGPPGAIIGTFSRGAAKEEFVTVLTRAQSGGCSGGSCGPGGCGPKK
jgi:hypothetical protein